MKKTIAAADPSAYVRELADWRRPVVDVLRGAVREAAPFDERIKWGHLVYLLDGPAVLIRAEEARVLLGFWRGQRLTGDEPRLKAGGKYEMATLEIRQGVIVDAAQVRLLARRAADLNQALGDPTRNG